MWLQSATKLLAKVTTGLFGFFLPSFSRHQSNGINKLVTATHFQTQLWSKMCKWDVLVQIQLFVDGMITESPKRYQLVLRYAKKCNTSSIIATATIFNPHSSSLWTILSENLHLNNGGFTLMNQNSTRFAGFTTPTAQFIFGEASSGENNSVCCVTSHC